MPNPARSEAFGDVLDPRFEDIFFGHLEELQDMLGTIYTMAGSNGREDMRWSDVGDFDDWEEFTGTVQYDELFQGFDTTVTPVEFASGFQVTRKLFDDDQYNIMDQRPRGLATSYNRTRQKHGARIFNNAFSVDSFFYNNSEGVALCSNAHLTNSGASTAVGFDNLSTAPLTAAAVSANRITMRNFRNDRGGRISVVPDELIIPVDLFEEAFEIVNSMGKVDTADNNRNVHQGVFDVIQWEYLTDPNNWFMGDGRMRRQFLVWTDRVEVEFAMAEDLDTLIAKWRGYARYAMGWLNWRFALGNLVS